MRDVLAYIQEQKRAFAALPVFEFMRDPSVPPEQRLALAPCMAHYVMTFADVNVYVLRQEPALDRYQELVNIHTYEDASHWPWYVEDLQRLGLDREHMLSEVLEFLWGEATVRSRVLSYEMCRLILQGSSLHRLAICECVEETGNVFLGIAADIGRDLQRTTQVEYVYYGPHHFGCESGHTMGTPGVERLLEEIELTDGQRAECRALVQRVFQLYASFVAELHAFALGHPIEELRSGPLRPGRHDRRQAGRPLAPLTGV
jgi:hypothetical protein